MTGYTLYLDEAGCMGTLPVGHSKIQPVFCLLGLIIPNNKLKHLTFDFLQLKREFNPAMAKSLSHNLDIINYEIKGSNLRQDFNKSRNIRRRALGFLDKSIKLLEKNDCRVLARAYIKNTGQAFDGNALYASSTRIIFESFQVFLAENESNSGVVIADSRQHKENTHVHHSIFINKYRQDGDPYPYIEYPPLFGNSENHVGIQLADLLVSAVMMPMLINVYCEGHLENIHIRPHYSEIKNRYVEKLRKLQFRYFLENYEGGIIVRDELLKSRSASLLFK